MYSNRPFPDFKEAGSVLTNDFFAELERNHKVSFPEYCRNIIRNSMAYEIGDRVEDDADLESHEKLLEPLTSFLNELEAQRAEKTSAFEHFDFRLTRFVNRQLHNSERRIEIFIAGLRDVERASAQKIPTPPKTEKKKQWLRDLHERLGIAEYKGRGAPPKSRYALYSELAWVWSEVGQKVTAVKNVSRSFVRFVGDIVKRFPKLDIHRGLDEDINKWHEGCVPLTEEQREANERLASAYRDGSLNFGQWRITPDGRPPRLLYDATEPQGK